MPTPTVEGNKAVQIQPNNDSQPPIEGGIVIENDRDPKPLAQVAARIRSNPELAPGEAYEDSKGKSGIRTLAIERADGSVVLAIVKDTSLGFKGETQIAGTVSQTLENILNTDWGRRLTPDEARTILARSIQIVGDGVGKQRQAAKAHDTISHESERIDASTSVCMITTDKKGNRVLVLAQAGTGTEVLIFNPRTEMVKPAIASHEQDHAPFKRSLAYQRQLADVARTIVLEDDDIVFTSSASFRGTLSPRVLAALTGLAQKKASNPQTQQFNVGKFADEMIDYADAQMQFQHRQNEDNLMADEIGFVAARIAP